MNGGLGLAVSGKIFINQTRDLPYKIGCHSSGTGKAGEQ
jgi:hypothetical protein